jgi:hypothetical protein
MPLLYTPRKFVSHPNHKLFYLVEADHRTLGSDVSEKQLADLVGCRLDISHARGAQTQMRIPIVRWLPGRSSMKTSSIYLQKYSGTLRLRAGNGLRALESLIPSR